LLVLVGLTVPGLARAADTANGFLAETPISAGAGHTCGVGQNGRLACWGDDSSGQTDASSAEFLAISAGGEHTCGIRAEGALACWGDDAHGQTDGLPSGAQIAVSAGGRHTCAIDAGGALACWGDDSAGQLDNVPAGQFVAVSAGGSHTCAIAVGGETTCWGVDLPGEPTATPPPAPLGHTPLTVGNDSNYNCILAADGRPSCWGADSLGGPLQSPPSETALAISGESQRTCLLNGSGAARCWGPQPLGWEPPPAAAFRALASTTGDSCAIGADGTLACWGNPSAVLAPPSGSFRAVSGGASYACAIRADGTLACWGDGPDAILSAVPTGAFRSVGTGNDRACGVRANGTLACWGANDLGYLEPVPPGQARAVAAGAYGMCAVLLGSDVACWEDGEAAPAQGGTFYSLAGGANHTCGVRTSGALSCLGHNEYGQTRPQLGELLLPHALLQQPYSHRIATTPEQPGSEFSITGGTLPPGLELAADGTVSGTPSVLGAYRFRLSVSNGVGEESEEEATLEVVASPVVGLDEARNVGFSGADLSGTVDPRNLPAEAWFEYWPAEGSSTSAQRTPTEAVAKGIGAAAVSAHLAGLTPDTEYLFRLSAANELGAEAVHSDTRALATTLAPPTAGLNFNVETVEGRVTTKCPSDASFTGLVRATQVPVGCVIDTTDGTVRITADRGGGETQTAYFWGGVFRVAQNSGANRAAVMKLVGKLRCERRASKGHRRRVNLRRRGSGRRLWGSGKGNYRTVGHHGSATVRGTTWLVQDRCDGSTLIKVKHGTVWVKDFVKGVRVVVHAGHRYLIEPPTPRLGG
jgi:Regulator of chromosome condensation (RCC1) repeat/Putative Ig domain